MPQLFQIFFDTSHYNNNSLLKATKEEKLGDKSFPVQNFGSFAEKTPSFSHKKPPLASDLSRKRKKQDSSFSKRKLPAFPKERTCDIINIEKHFLFFREMLLPLQKPFFYPP